MPISNTLEISPAAAVPLAKLEALGNLLNVADPGRWDSLARPSAQGLAGLIFGLHAELADCIVEPAD